MTDREWYEMQSLLSKVKKTYQSCTSREQWKVAFKFSRQVMKKFPYEALRHVILDIEDGELARIIQKENQ